MHTLTQLLGDTIVQIFAYPLEQFSKIEKAYKYYKQTLIGSCRIWSFNML